MSTLGKATCATQQRFMFYQTNKNTVKKNKLRVRRELAVFVLIYGVIAKLIKPIGGSIIVVLLLLLLL